MNSHQPLMVTHPTTGMRMLVRPNSTAPLLTILLTAQPVTERGIEVEFPEHVTGRQQATQEVEHLYLPHAARTDPSLQPEPVPTWRQEAQVLSYTMRLRHNVHVVARAELERDGIRFRYTFTNHMGPDYAYFQAVTCVKLYDAFADPYLERTYVHHPDGFDLLASELPQRLAMPLADWFPCRYLVPFRWPVVALDRRVEQEDGITRYHKSRRVDEPFIATLSQDGLWLAATYTPETGNVWTNPERTCHHADPAVALARGASKRVELKTFLFHGTLDHLLERVAMERQQQTRRGLASVVHEDS